MSPPSVSGCASVKRIFSLHILTLHVSMPFHSRNQQSRDLPSSEVLSSTYGTTLIVLERHRCFNWGHLIALIILSMFGQTDHIPRFSDSRGCRICVECCGDSMLSLDIRHRQTITLRPPFPTC